MDRNRRPPSQLFPVDFREEGALSVYQGHRRFPSLCPLPSSAAPTESDHVIQGHAPERSQAPPVVPVQAVAQGPVGDSRSHLATAQLTPVPTAPQPADAPPQPSSAETYHASHAQPLAAPGIAQHPIVRRSPSPVLYTSRPLSSPHDFPDFHPHPDSVSPPSASSLASQAIDLYAPFSMLQWQPGYTPGAPVRRRRQRIPAVSLNQVEDHSVNPGPCQSGSAVQQTPTSATRSHVKVACSNCNKAGKRCDDARPCGRCVATGRDESCVSNVHKARPKGYKRGPYKKYKDPHTMTYDELVEFIEERKADEAKKAALDAKRAAREAKRAQLEAEKAKKSTPARGQ
ncbi:unnamed protein product [Peniophora sp. CBMAI 1063]|nr:unnamed protein product [Peniophora sp. CBMAI 1063]